MKKKSKSRLKQEFKIQRFIGGPRITWKVYHDKFGNIVGYGAELTKNQQQKYYKFMKEKMGYEDYEDST